MHVNQLQIENFRIIESLRIRPTQGINLITGGNGAGKTSVLEAIYLAGRGRSFRHREAGPFIRYESKSSQVIVRGSTDRSDEFILGIERSPRSFRLRLNGDDLKRRSDLLRALPLQLITPQSHELLERGPDIRRRFIDLGLFHVEHKFHSWQSDYSRTLKQRNAALRFDSRIATSWDVQLGELAEKIHDTRVRYIEQLARVSDELIKKLNPDLEAAISYKAGWDPSTPLEKQLENHLSRDLKSGHTSVGPHRADLVFTTQSRVAEKQLSRGQQKLLVCALHLGQAGIIDTLTNVKPILLIDDLPAELDRVHRSRLVNLLHESGLQSFITAIELDQLTLNQDCSVFHVEQGRCIT